MRRVNVILWTIQVLLAASFLFAGSVKVFTPTATLAPMIAPLPMPLIRFIGCCEVIGAVGLILPGLLRILPVLTPIAASCLVIIMSGAVSASITMGKTSSAPGPAVLGILALVIVYGRFVLAPIPAAPHVRRGLQPPA